jgi:hypothetical protein
LRSTGTKMSRVRPTNKKSWYDDSSARWHYCSNKDEVRFFSNKWREKAREGWQCVFSLPYWLH